MNNSWRIIKLTTIYTVTQIYIFHCKKHDNINANNSEFRIYLIFLYLFFHSQESTALKHEEGLKMIYTNGTPWRHARRPLE